MIKVLSHKQSTPQEFKIVPDANQTGWEDGIETTWDESHNFTKTDVSVSTDTKFTIFHGHCSYSQGHASFYVFRDLILVATGCSDSGFQLDKKTKETPESISVLNWLDDLTEETTTGFVLPTTPTRRSPRIPKPNPKYN